MRKCSIVFLKLLDAGFHLNRYKCKLHQSPVVYLAHVIDAEGLHPTEEKMHAILDAPPPKDLSAFESLIGLMIFYSMFL